MLYKIISDLREKLRGKLGKLLDGKSGKCKFENVIYLFFFVLVDVCKVQGGSEDDRPVLLIEKWS